MYKLLLVLLGLFLFGCNQPHVRVTNPDTQFTCMVRPIIVTRDGTSSWTKEMVDRRTSVVNQVYANAKIHFEFQPIEYLERIELEEANEDDFITLCKLAKEHSETRAELAVYFVYSLEYRGICVGGLSNLPSNMIGTWYQFGVAIAVNSYDDTVAHELGHTFNLKHPWEDDAEIKDTPSSSAADCDTPEKFCNVMSYCEDRPLLPECLSKNLSAQQCQMVRDWAASYPRNQVVTSSSPVTPSRVLFYTNNIEPAMDK